MVVDPESPLLSTSESVIGGLCSILSAVDFASSRGTILGVSSLLCADDSDSSLDRSVLPKL